MASWASPPRSAPRARLAEPPWGRAQFILAKGVHEADALLRGDGGKPGVHGLDNSVRRTIGDRPDTPVHVPAAGRRLPDPGVVRAQPRPRRRRAARPTPARARTAAAIRSVFP